MNYRLEALAAEHQLDAFSCGTPTLDEWLVRHARPATGQGTRTYVLVTGTRDEAVGYFAIAPHLLEREQTPRSIGRGAPALVPAILLAKLALHERLHHAGLGRELLINALQTIITAARSAGGRIIVVDAIDANADAFYQAHDFQPLPSNPQRLVIKLGTAARALGVPWP